MQERSTRPKPDATQEPSGLVAVGTIMLESPKFFELVQKTRYHQRLLATVQTHLPPDLRAHCSGVTTIGGQLLLFTESSVWATRLRYQQRDLIDRLREQAYLPISAVRIQVVPPAQILSPARRPLQLSHANAATIRKAATTIGDSGLRAALERLAKHARSSFKSN